MTEVTRIVSAIQRVDAQAARQLLAWSTTSRAGRPRRGWPGRGPGRPSRCAGWRRPPGPSRPDPSPGERATGTRTLLERSPRLA
jgi:hypothetical protein